MFKRLVVLALALGLLTSSVAALDFDRKEFYGQAILALPIGNLSNVANIGFGGGLGLRAPSSDELFFRGEISYIYFSTKDIAYIDWSWSMIPVYVLGEYHLDSLYLLGGLGLVFTRSSWEYKAGHGLDPWDDWKYLYGPRKGSDTSSDIGLVLGAGFELSPSMVLEGRLNVISNANSLSANLLFRF